VLPNALEKHCIQAEPILDKNALAGKKVASAHLPLWICRRFSTDAAVLRVFCWRLQAWESVCGFIGGQRSLVRILCRQEVVVFLCASVGLATFFLKTKNARAVLALSRTLQAGLSVCLFIGGQRSLLSIFVGKKLSFFLALVSALPLSSCRQKTLEQCWRFLLPGPFRRPAKFFHAQPLSYIS
jgi:hypothetical protein